MRFAEVRLAAPVSLLPALREYYGEALGLDTSANSRIAVGETILSFEAAEGAPFYHFALLVPGDRFDAARAWVAATAPLLPVPGSAETEFDFSDWDARACYIHDPAGNIVELIAHRGLGESGRGGAFSAGELLGLSEVGLVGDPSALARQLAGGLELETWDGAVSAADRLGFIGAKGRTFVLCATGRGWLPTGRPAEPHPIRAVIHGARRGDVRLNDGRYRIASR